MKKPKSINFPFLILVLLFVLSQTTFALTANLSAGKAETAAQQSETEISPDGADPEAGETPAAAGILSAADDAQLKVQADATANNTAAPTPTPVPTPAPTLVPTPAPTPTPVIKAVVRYVNADELNVREAANSQSKLVTTVKRGDKVTYYETIGEWARIITWTDKKGYILAKYLVDSEKAVENLSKPAAVKKAATTVSRSSTSEKTEASKPATSEASSLAQKVVSYAKSLQGIKYVYGGSSKSGFDCSGFTKYVFDKYGISVPRSSSGYWGTGTKVARSDIRAGDIVLFDTDGGSADVSHVGIYVGGGNFIHASTSKGKVIVMNLNSYQGKYMGARRVIK